MNDDTKEMLYKIGGMGDPNGRYPKPWKKLTEEERASFDAANPKTQEEWDALFNGIETKLKEKNA